MVSPGPHPAAGVEVLITPPGLTPIVERTVTICQLLGAVECGFGTALGASRRSAMNRTAPATCPIADRLSDIKERYARVSTSLFLTRPWVEGKGDGRGDWSKGGL